MFGRLRPALMAAALLMAPLATGMAAQAAPPTEIAADHHDDDQGGRGGQGGFGQGDFWFDHHCRQMHEWWQPRCQRDGGDMWHRGDPPSIGSR